MASPWRKEEPVARPLFRWAGGERGLGLGDAVAPAVTVSRPAKLVTLKVQDAQRRVVARTMRRTEKLQVLMDYYYDMVSSAGAGGMRGAGRFVFDGKRLTGEQTPEGLGMKSGDKIDFFGDGGDAVEEEVVDRKPVIKPGVHVTVKVQDTKGRTVKLTVRITQKLLVIMDAYYTSVPDVARGTGKFLYDGRQVNEEQTPAELKMDDEEEDEILIDFFIDMMGGGGGGWAATVAEQLPVPA